MHCIGTVHSPSDSNSLLLLEIWLSQYTRPYAILCSIAHTVFKSQHHIKSAQYTTQQISTDHAVGIWGGWGKSTKVPVRNFDWPTGPPPGNQSFRWPIANFGGHWHQGHCQCQALGSMFNPVCSASANWVAQFYKVSAWWCWAQSPNPAQVLNLCNQSP